MDYNRIELLLHKYLEGVTTISEEEELRVFFTTNEKIPENLLFAKDLFCYFNEEKSGGHAKTNKTRRMVSRRSLYYISGIAASLLLALILTLPNYQSENTTIYAYVDGKAITDISIAEQYTKQILLSTAEKIDIGAKSLHYAGQFTNPISIINN